MKMIPTLSYRDIYDEELPALTELLKGIPSVAVIGVFSKINALIYLNKNSLNLQQYCFSLLARRFNNVQRDLVLNKIISYANSKGENTTIFALWYTMSFIQYEILNFRDIDAEDTTPEQEYCILKAYFVIVELCNEKHLKLFKNVEKKKNDELFFQKTTWPILLEQYIFNFFEDASYLLIRTMTLFSYITSQKELMPFLTTFLNTIERKSYWDYVTSFLGISHISLSTGENGWKEKYTIKPPFEADPVTHLLLLDINEYQKSARKAKDFLGIKEKPLFQFADFYLVLNWGFLNNKIYSGLIFDFYNRSGLNQKFKKIPDFLSYIAYNVSEKILFRGLITKMFNKKHNTLGFDDSNMGSQPDCYLRIGKYIFLFEFKDAQVSSETVDSCNYELIKADIDKKFITNGEGKAKGITQLFNQICYLNSKCYEFDNFVEKRIKRRNIIIYPIIVYTNHLYSLPGINHYLNNQFSKLTFDHQKTSKLEFLKVKEIIMIDIEFLYRNFKVFENNNDYFKEKLDEYLNVIQKRLKRIQHMFSPEAVLNAYEPFELVVNPYHGSSDNRKFDVVSELFELFNIEIPNDIIKE